MSQKDKFNDLMLAIKEDEEKSEEQKRFLFSPLGHPRFQAPPLMRLHSACCSSLIPSITLWDNDDFGET